MRKKQVLMCISTEVVSSAIRGFVLTLPRVLKHGIEFPGGTNRLYDPERLTNLLLVDLD